MSTSNVKIVSTDQVYNVLNQAANTTVKLQGGKSKNTPSLILAFTSALRSVQSDGSGTTGFAQIVDGVKNKNGNITFSFEGGRTVIVSKNLFGFAQRLFTTTPATGQLFEVGSVWTAYAQATPPGPGPGPGPIPPTPTPGQTFTLTTNLDFINGSANNTVTNASVFASNGNDLFLANNTLLTAGDTIDGLGGIDTLKITAGAAIDTTIATIANIELVELIDAVAAADITHNLAGVSALTGFTLKNDNNNAKITTISGLKSTVGVTLDNHTDGTVALVYSDAAVVGDQTATITYKGGNGDGGTDMTAAGIEVVNLVASGSASKVGDLTFDAAKTVNINADEAFTILDLNLANAATKTLNISGDSKVTATTVTTDGALTAINVSGTATYVQGDALGTAAGLVVTATGAAALDVLTGTATHKITGGSGADRISIGTTVLTTGTLDGGAGTADILHISEDSATVFTTATKARISNFEILEVTTAATKTVNFEDLAGLTGLIIGTGTSLVFTNVSATAAADVKVTGVQTTALSIGVKNATNPGTADTLKLTLDHVTDATAVTINDLTINGVETLQIHSTGGSITNTLDLLAANRLSSVTITGDSAFTLTDEADLATQINVNASALTAAFSANLEENTSGVSIIGSATKANTITGALAASILTGGSAADTITGSTLAGGDTIIGGAGADTIGTAVVTGTIATVITGGLGADLIGLNGVATADKKYTINATAAESFATADQFDIITFANHTDTKLSTVTMVTGLLNSTLVGATQVVVGTTTVAAGSFIAVGSVNSTLTTSKQNFVVFQDSNSNGIIDATDFSVSFVCTGIATDTLALTIVGGQLVATLTGVA